MASGDFINQLSQASRPGLRLRTGTVVDVDTQTVQVEFGVEGPASIPCLAHVTGLIVGDVVQILADGTRMVIIGRLPVGSDGATLYNGDFSRGLDGWMKYEYGGQCEATLVDTTTEPRALRVTSTSTSTAPNTHMISKPMPCEVGQVWALSAWVNGDQTGSEAAMGAYLGMSWFADDGILYPSYVSGDTIAASNTSVTPQTSWIELDGTVTVPSGATWCRLYLRTQRGTAGTGALLWAHVSCRNMVGAN